MTLETHSQTPAQNPLLLGLNNKQQEAVTLPPTHALILAGAGSGKTRVLVHRLGYLMSHLNISPYEILSVTFTNKAAAEMRERIENLFALNTQGLWVGTFHGIAHRLLRQHYNEAGLPEAFQVIDSDDQLRMVKRLLKQLNMDDKKWAPRQVQSFINRQKEEGRRAGMISRSGDYFEDGLIKVYQGYESQCQQSGLVDFSELLLRVAELLQHNIELRTHYQNRFKHILVDEFQDTNTIQYRWLKLLISQSDQIPQNYLMVVGDDDQSIYGWRGAKIENIHRFQKEFSPTLIRLEQNYRSTKNILSAANSVIANNPSRLGKELWTEGDSGELIQIYSAFNELDESRFVTNLIKQKVKSNYSKYKDFAVLYRSNAQSRVIEEALIQQNIPYRIYGGMRFFERQEIKDALAYLRIIFNRKDDAAFERIINTPTRGIGEKSLQMVRDTAREYQIDLYQATQKVCQNNSLSGRAINALSNFLNLIEALDSQIKTHNLQSKVETVIEKSQLITHYEKEGREKAQARLENLSELVSAAKQFEYIDTAVDEETDENQAPLAAFLTHAVLEAGEQQAGQHDDAVQLMTLHSAKGLEFPTVFIIGMEDELFPGARAIDNLSDLEESRRLCYVGMTRAMQCLYLTYAEYRRWYGENKPHTPSRFLREIPDQYTHSIRMKSQMSTPLTAQNYSGYVNRRQTPQTPQKKSFQTYSKFQSKPKSQGVFAKGKSWAIGQNVSHPKFGEGVILNTEGQGDQARLYINFSEAGSKWLVVGYAPLS